MVARLTRLNNKRSLAAESRVRMNWGSVLSVNLEGEEVAVRVEVYSSRKDVPNDDVGIVYDNYAIYVVIFEHCSYSSGGWIHSHETVR